MTILAILLLGLGAADLARPIDAQARGAVWVRSLVIGTVVIAVTCFGTGLSWLWAAGLIAALCAWITLTPSRGRIWPLVGLAITALLLIALDTALPSAHGWLPDIYDALRGGPTANIPFVEFALGVGVMAFLADTSNVIVRIVLHATDSRTSHLAPTLKGGRVLGPLERVFIFAMALAGQYLAISAVVAAKSIIRFPEISQDSRGTKAEYFLVGSFVSWGLGLVPVLLFIGAGR